MQISSKGRYALRIMIDLAINKDQGPVRVKDIAARQGISEKYLDTFCANCAIIAETHRERIYTVSADAV